MTTSCPAVGNVAYLKTATQGGGTNGNNHAGLAIDGNHNPTFRSIPRTCAHPSGSVLAWWRVDLGATYVILSVNITNRGDCCRREFASCLNTHKCRHPSPQSYMYL